jgi:glycosyltransferase involved in cell wall biosynthesis
MSNIPTVSVIIPAYNAASYIGETLNSVIHQTYTDFEILVVDDGSSDDTSSVVKAFDDDRIICIYQSNQGVSVARNTGIFQARGEYIAFLDADDLWHQEKLKVQVNAFETESEPCVCYCDRKVFSDVNSLGVGNDDEGLNFEMSTEQLFSSLLKHNHIHCSSVMVRRKLFARSGVFDPMLRASEDSDLWMRAARYTSFLHIKGTLSYYRHHENNTVNSIKFRRNRLNAELMFLARYFEDDNARRIMLDRLKGSSHTLAYEEEAQSNFKSAYKLFLASFVLGKRGVKAFVKLIILWFRA